MEQSEGGGCLGRPCATSKAACQPLQVAAVCELAELSSTQVSGFNSVSLHSADRREQVSHAFPLPSALMRASLGAVLVTEMYGHGGQAFESISFSWIANFDARTTVCDPHILLLLLTSAAHCAHL